MERCCPGWNRRTMAYSSLDRRYFLSKTQILSARCYFPSKTQSSGSTPNRLVTGFLSSG